MGHICTVLRVITWSNKGPRAELKKKKKKIKRVHLSYECNIYLQDQHVVVYYLTQMQEFSRSQVFFVFFFIFQTFCTAWTHAIRDRNA